MKILAIGKDRKITAEAKGDTLYLEIDGPIGKWYKANVSDIKREIKAFGKNTSKASVYINSEGGSVFEANEIVNILEDTFKEVKVKIGALAASAATIFLTRFSSIAKRNSQIMIHKPQMCTCGTADAITASVVGLQNLQDQYSEDYAKKMGITVKQLNAKWQNDYWMTAKQAQKEGLIDEVEDDDAEITDTLQARMVACGVPNMTAITKPKPKKEDMDIKVMAAQLGLPTDATEQEVQAKLAEVQAKAAKADALEAQMKANKEAQRKADVKALLDDAEKAHKINAKTRKNYEALANSDFDQVKAIIADLPAMTGAPSANLQTGGGDVEARTNWTYMDYAEKDPEAFDKLPEAKQKALTDAHFAE